MPWQILLRMSWIPICCNWIAVLVSTSSSKAKLKLSRTLLFWFWLTCAAKRVKLWLMLLDTDACFWVVLVDSWCNWIALTMTSIWLIWSNKALNMTGKLKISCASQFAFLRSNTKCSSNWCAYVSIASKPIAADSPLIACTMRKHWFAKSSWFEVRLSALANIEFKAPRPVFVFFKNCCNWKVSASNNLRSKSKLMLDWPLSFSNSSACVTCSVTSCTVTNKCNTRLSSITRLNWKLKYLGAGAILFEVDEYTCTCMSGFKLKIKFSLTLLPNSRLM